ncbi:MAG: response regulator [Blastocatellia bacterium]
MNRVLVAEDHENMRVKVIGLLGTEYLIVGIVGDGAEMLEAEAEVHPDVVVLDISMPTMSGIEAAIRLKERSSKAKVVFLTLHEDPAVLEAALATGALGYVLKRRLVSDLKLAIREALAGRLFVSPTLQSPDGDCRLAATT